MTSVCDQCGKEAFCELGLKIDPQPERRIQLSWGCECGGEMRVLLLVSKQTNGIQVPTETKPKLFLPDRHLES